MFVLHCRHFVILRFSKAEDPEWHLMMMFEETVPKHLQTLALLSVSDVLCQLCYQVLKLPGHTESEQRRMEEACNCLQELICHNVPPRLADPVTHCLLENLGRHVFRGTAPGIENEEAKCMRIVRAVFHPCVTRLSLYPLTVQLMEYVFFHVLPTLTKIRELELAPFVYTASLAVVPTIGKLQQLECLTYRFECTDRFLQEQLLSGSQLRCLVRSMEALQRLQHLEELDVMDTALENSDFLQLSGIASLRKLRCSCLKTSDVNKLVLPQLREASFRKLTANKPLEEKGLPQLHSLSLSYSWSSRDLFVNIGRQLQELKLHRVYTIDIWRLAEQCPSLQQLSVRECQHTELPREGPNFPTFPTMREFRLKGKYPVNSLNVLLGCHTIEKIEVISDWTWTETSQRKDAVCKFVEGLLTANPLSQLREFTLHAEGGRMLLQNTTAISLKEQCPNIQAVQLGFRI